ncbi:hypothetical protein [Synechococcus sp. CS-1328]|uniref:hypothetical protein n=1 Tax=Synechococcus sp. CS-1328 TaxID=2847976 RepID=UPI00223B1314|nr:hypothetical protein [Synechococcus sp. CS-1328]
MKGEPDAHWSQSFLRLKQWPQTTATGSVNQFIGFHVMIDHNPQIRKILGPLAATVMALAPAAAEAAPYGTWLSQPQIWFHSTKGSLSQVMAQIRSENYQVVFLDYRKVSDSMQQEVAREARRHGLMPVVWVQSPQYRRMSIRDLVVEARHADGIQVDDHFFANYNQSDFYVLRRAYTNPIFCSIQPFQAGLAPHGGCNQLDVQCYTPETFQNCVKLADKMGAVVSLSTANTLSRQAALGGRRFNTFLWPGLRD